MKKLHKLLSLPVAGVLVASLSKFAYAIGDVCSSGATVEVKRAAGCFGNNDALPKIITSILSGIIAAAGLVAVVYIIVGGVQYMTSGGDAAKIEKAKKIILYAVIGLVVCALSFAIVNFVVLGLLK